LGGMMVKDDVAAVATSVLLSRRNPASAGWVAIDEFEDLFQRLCGTRILCPDHRSLLRDPFGKVQRRLLGRYHKLKENVERDAELLLVVARTPSDLSMLYSLTDSGKRFRKIAGYVIDSYFSEGFESSVKSYDHIFSTTQEGAHIVRTRYGVSSSVLPQGFDCLAWASTDRERSIDLLGFGRQPASYHLEFQRSFHAAHSDILYLHSPIGAKAGTAVWVERPMMLKLLQRSKMSLAFHLMVEPDEARPRAASFVTSRWFESLTAGCIIVGRRPPGEMAAEMFDWPNALIDLPNQPSESTEFIKSLACDASFLQETRTRNVIEMCRRHDWRYRIRDIYQHFELSLPESLTAEIIALQILANNIDTEK
jgi:hypothetical protein